MRAGVLFLGLGAACTAPGPAADGVIYTDQYTATRAVCDWDGYLEEHGWAIDNVGGLNWPKEVPYFPSEACVDAILADFHADPQALIEFEGLEDPATQILEGRGWGSRYYMLLTAARTLFIDDFGRVDELRPSELIDREYVVMMQSVRAITGVESLGAAQYNFVTSIVRQTRPNPCGGRIAARFNSKHGTLQLCETFGRIWGGLASSVLVHEAAHALYGSHVPCDGKERRECDHTTRGAHGFGLASSMEFYRRAPDEWWSADFLRSDITFTLRNINSFLDDETGELDPYWLTADLRQY